VVGAVLADPGLDERQKRVLLDVYDSFRQEFDARPTAPAAKKLTPRKTAKKTAPKTATTKTATTKTASNSTTPSTAARKAAPRRDT